MKEQSTANGPPEEVAINVPSPFDDTSGNYTPVSLSDSPYPPVAESLFSVDQSTAPYRHWSMTARYVWEEGIGMMPIAGLPVGNSGANGIGVVPTPGDPSRRAAQISSRIRPLPGI